MKPKSPDTYENILKHYNKDYSPSLICSCGKIVTQRFHEKHLKTKLHDMLIRLKKQCEELKELQAKAEKVVDIL